MARHHRPSPTFPHHNRQVYVIAWQRQGGKPVHRFYFKRWYAERRAITLRQAGYDVQLYATNATWTPLTQPSPGVNR